MIESGGSELYWLGGSGQLARRLRTAAPVRLSMVRIFRHYVPIQLVALALIETCIFYAAIYLGAAIRFTPEDLADIGPIWPRAVVFAVVMVASMTALGMYTRETPKETSGTTRSSCRASSSAGWP